MNTRIEHDLLGDMALPADIWYGIQTQRALGGEIVTEGKPSGEIVFEIKEAA